MKLRDYQKRGCDIIWRDLATDNRILAKGPTGCGKTVMFTELIKRFVARGVHEDKCAVVMGRDNLVSQTIKRVSEHVPVGVWSAGQGEKRIDQVNVISIHSADKLTIERLRLLIVDEAHNLNEGRYKKFIDRHPETKVVGFTATPWRNNVNIYGDDCFFPRLNFSVGVNTLIKSGYLVPPVARAMRTKWDTTEVSTRGGEYVTSELVKLVDDRSKISDQIKDALPRLEDRKKIVITCVSIEHAEAIADKLASIGESVVVIHSRVKDASYALECFKKGPHRFAVSVMMLSEGIDIPSIDAIVLMRPTKSCALAVQTVGRGLRPCEGKKDCVILDYGSVFENCGPIDAPYVKDKKTKRTKETFKPLLRICSECTAYVSSDLAKCPECGHMEQKVVDRMKELSRQASASRMLSSELSWYECYDLDATRYTSRKGNDCLLFSFYFSNRIRPLKVYCTGHPKGWKKAKVLIGRYTPFEFNSWQEAWDSVDRFGPYMTHPKRVAVKQNGDYEELVDVED